MATVGRVQLLHEEYIRLTERFKALWTFHQFLRGIQKTFFSSEPDFGIDLNTLYEDVKRIAGKIDTQASETLELQIKHLFEQLDAAAGKLREVDRRISPSYVRRFFEKVRPQDEKIAFHLLRFYFSQGYVDEDVIDKVDFLATVGATGRGDPGAAVGLPRPDIRHFFDSVTSESAWPQIENGLAPTIARAFDELATDMARAREFEDLVTARLLENVRTMKHRIAAGMSHPEVLTAVACCNLTTRSIFQRLYEREERRLDEATGRIADLARELERGGEDFPSPEEIRRFRELRNRFDEKATEKNLRAHQVVELKAAIAEVLEKFDISGLEAEDIDEALELVEEAEAEGRESAFWKPLVDRILAAVELYDDGTGPLRTNISGLTHLKLEPWELKAARRAVSAQGEPPSERDGILLRAVALRLKAEEETEALHRAAELGPPGPETLRAARATLARVPQLDAALLSIIDEANAGSLSEEVRSWTRSRFRLLRSTADLWLMYDSPRSDRRGS